ncbi:MAG: ankyrin repeat domain-containing protein, partial [Proteobacteria bacterium]|nr:ankyrin repeat domain-containing protein [Pseudomonadota bacterium]
KYFIVNGIDEERARFFSDGIRHKDKEGIPISIIHKLIHDSDCLDVMRLAKSFRMEEMDFYKQYSRAYHADKTDAAALKGEFEEGDNPALQDFLQLCVEARDVIRSQGDLGRREIGQGDLELWCSIAINGDEQSLLLDALDRNVDEVIKKQFEHSQTPFQEVVSSIYQNPFFQELKLTYDDLLDAQRINEVNQSKKKTSIDQTEKTELREDRDALGLSSQERAIMQTLLDMDLILHHSNKSSVDALIEDKVLKYQQEFLRDKRDESEMPRIHTDDREGVRDNVFYGLGTKQHSSGANFVDTGESLEVQIDLKTVWQHNPEALRGLVVTDHLYHYLEQEVKSKGEAETVKIGGSDFEWVHTYGDANGDANGDDERLLKLMLYRQASGSTLVEYKEFGDEAYEVNDLEIIALIFIQKLRNLGQDNELYKHLLDHPNDKSVIARAMEELLRVDDFEIKLPVSFRLDQEGVTLLHAGSEEEVEQIRQQHPNLTIISKQQIIREVHEAIMNGDVDRLEELYEKGYKMDGNLYRLSVKAQPVALAIKNNQTECLKWLLEKGFNQKCFSKSLITTEIHDESKSRIFKDAFEIQFAIDSSRPLTKEMAGLLNDKGFQRPKIENIKDLSGYFLYLGFSGNSELAKAILQYGGEVVFNNTSLIDSTIYNIPVCIEALIEYAKETGQDLELAQPFMHACENGHVEVVQAFIAYAKETGKDLGIAAIQDLSEITAFMYACENGNVEVVQALIAYAKETGKDLGLAIQDLSERTAFMYACKNGHVEVVQAFIAYAKETGQDLGLAIRDYLGKTTLMYACKNGHVEVVQALIAYAKETGQDLGLEKTDKSGKTALDYASEDVRQKLSQLIEDGKKTEKDLGLLQQDDTSKPSSKPKEPQSSALDGSKDNTKSSGIKGP